MARITHMPHLFSMKHIFLEMNAASLSIEKKERKKIFEFQQLFWRHKIQRNTNRFEYHIIQQLFNDENVPPYHTENLFYENTLIPFKYTLLLFSHFYILGVQI